MIYLIDQQSQLNDLQPVLQKVAQNKMPVGIDTEFKREKTYFARLCLLQLAVEDDQYCIDVLAIKDLSILVELLTNQDVVKIIHACRQDMEVVLHTLNIIIKPVFDTQLAAAFTGKDLQISYAALTEKTLQVKLPKSQVRSDWERRPLSAEQIEYAGNDVAYLLALYNTFQQKLTEEGKLSWYQQEIEDFYQQDKYQAQPEYSYKKISGSHLPLLQQYVLRMLTEWREIQAIKLNIPRNWLIKKDDLFKVASAPPKTVEQVQNSRMFSKKLNEQAIKELLESIEQVKPGKDPLWSRNQGMSAQDKKTCNKMMAEVNRLAQQHQLAPALLATRKDINKLYQQQTDGRLSSGWRVDLIGNALQVLQQQN